MALVLIYGSTRRLLGNISHILGDGEADLLAEHLHHAPLGLLLDLADASHIHFILCKKRGRLPAEKLLQRDPLPAHQQRPRLGVATAEPGQA